MNRKIFIDLLRAASCLWVILYHASLTRWLDLSPIGPLRGVLDHGYLGVHVFLVLSGYCVFASVGGAKHAGPFMFDRGEFYYRRFWRLYPAYLAALVLFTIGSFLFRPEYRHLGELAKQFFSHLVLVHNLIPSTFNGIDGPMWSLALECQLYLLFPLFVNLVNKRGWTFTVLLVLAFTLAYQLGLGFVRQGEDRVFNYAVFARMFEFVVGMWICQLGNRKDLGMGLITAVGGVVLTLAFYLTVNYGRFTIGVDQMFGIGFGAVLLLGLRIKDEFWEHGFWVPLSHIGFYSYSIYLLHQPILNTVFTPLLKKFHLTHIGPFYAAIVFVFIPVICLAGYGFWWVFEKPYLKKRRTPKPAPVAG